MFLVCLFILIGQWHSVSIVNLLNKGRSYTYQTLGWSELDNGQRNFRPIKGCYLSFNGQAKMLSVNILACILAIKKLDHENLHYF